MNTLDKKAIHYPCCFSIKITADTLEKIKSIKGHRADIIAEIRGAIEEVVNTQFASVQTPPQPTAD